MQVASTSIDGLWQAVPAAFSHVIDSFRANMEPTTMPNGQCRGREREGEKQSEKGSAHVVAAVQHATVLCNRIVANENDRVYYYSADWATGLLLRRD